MNTRLPSIKAKEVIKVLKQLGFIERRQTGSHLILRHKINKNIIPVPIHSKDLKKGTLHQILKLADLTKQEFIQVLKNQNLTK